MMDLLNSPEESEITLEEAMARVRGKRIADTRELLKPTPKEIKRLVKKAGKNIAKRKIYTQLKQRLSSRAVLKKVPRATVRLRLQKPLSPMSQQKSLFFKF